MKLFCRRYLPILLVLVIALTLFTLGAKKSGDKIPLSEVIISSSSDIVPSTGELFVYLNDSYSKKLGKVNPNKYWSITPKVEGRFYKSGRNRLVFSPSTGFKPGGRYTFKLELDNLLNEKRLEDFELDFTVPLNEITRFNYYTSYDGNSSQTLLQGNISFNGKVDLEQLNEGVNLKAKSGLEYNIIWKGYGGTYWNFEIGPLNIKDVKNELKLEFDKKSLAMRNDATQTMEVREAKEFNLKSLYWDQIRMKNLVVLTFDCGLDKFQDLDGLIKVTPECKFSTTIRDDRIYLNGDFVPGTLYEVKVAASVKNHYNVNMKAAVSKRTTSPDLKQILEFSEAGNFLSTLSDNKVAINVVNVEKVNLVVKKIYEKNLAYFLDFNNLTNNEGYYGYDNIQYYGEFLLNEDIVADSPRNRLNRIDLDLSKLASEKDGSIFIVEIKNPDEWRTQRKIIIKSDLAVSMFNSESETVTSVRDIETGKPISNAKVDFISEQHLELATAFTDDNGLITGLKLDKTPKYVVAKKFEKMGLLLPNNMMWNTSTFDIGGTSMSDGVLIHSYLDRKVYRPGEKVTLAAIVRDKDGEYPDELPLKVLVYNAENKLLSEQVLKESKEGFFFYQYQTSESDLTGGWRFDINAGSAYESVYFDLQTVMANRITVNLTTDKEKYTGEDEKIEIDAKCDYLFGKPGSGLKGKISLSISSFIKSFKKWDDYTFFDKERKFTKLEKELKNGLTDEDGNINIDWHIPDYPALPSALNLVITGEVTDNNRPVQTKKIVTYEKYDRYVGLKSEDYYLKRGQKQKFKIVYVDNNGNPVAKEKLKVKVYYQEYNWWYNSSSSKVSFKEDYNTSLVTEKTLKSKKKPIFFSFTPEQKGKYLIEVIAPNGHATSIEKQTSWWSSEGGSMRSEGLITLKSDKSNYKIGDKAKITFPAPESCHVLYTFSKDGKVLMTKSIDMKVENNEGLINIDITEAMMPNAYLTVSIIQPITVSKNDRPIRMYGVIPIRVEDSKTRLKFELKTPEKVKPGSKLTCELQTELKKKIPFTLYVIDEGLVTLTPYRVGNPWDTFYAKRRLQAMPYDNYPWFIGLPQGDAFMTYSVGGDMMFERAMSGAGRLMKDEVGNDELLQRFEPLAICKGVLETDANGFASVDFDIPNYQGAVRVIAVAASGNSYGIEQKLVKVLDDIIVMPTLPRVMHPGDIAEIPISVFAVDKEIKSVNLEVEMDDKYELVSEIEKKLKLVNNQATTSIRIKANRTGSPQIRFIAKGNDKTVNVSKTLPIIPASALQTKDTLYRFNEENRVNLSLLEKDTLAYNRVELHVNDVSTPNLLKYLDQLTRFPYGCTEQIISKAFPLLYVRDVFPEQGKEFYRVEEQIDYTIQELAKRQKYDGSLSLWYNGETNQFLSNYAMHFLIAAEKEGFFVPETLKVNLLASIKNYISTIDLQNYSEYACYGYYVLAKAGEANLGSMNYMKEEMMDKLKPIDKWFLATAYKLAGIDKTAEALSKNLDYDFGHKVNQKYFATSIRDKAIALICLYDLQDTRQNDLYTRLLLDIEHQDYLSTNELSYSLIGFGQMLKARPRKELSGGTVTVKDLDSSKELEIKLDKRMQIVNIPQDWSSNIEIDVPEGLPADNTVITVSEKFKSYSIEQKDEENGLKIRYNFFKDGVKIKPSDIKAGDRFKLVASVEMKQQIHRENYALAVPLPSCWEPDQVELLNRNTINNQQYRLSDDPNDLGINGIECSQVNPEHFEIRDDRALFFFNLYGSSSAFVVPLTAVTKGEFEMAPLRVINMYYGNYNATKSGLKITCE